MKTKQNKQPVTFGELVPRALAKLPEGVKFLALLTLTCWLPAVVFCLVINQSAVSYGMICDQALGGLLGVLIYKQPARETQSCIPASHAPDVKHESDIRELKKAA